MISKILVSIQNRCDSVWSNDHILKSRSVIDPKSCTVYRPEQVEIAQHGVLATTVFQTQPVVSVAQCGQSGYKPLQPEARFPTAKGWALPIDTREQYWRAQVLF